MTQEEAIGPPLEFESLFESEYSRLLAMLTLQCGDRFVAEELTQEAFTRLAQHWKRVSAMDDPSAWLWRVGFNLSRSFLRRVVAERRAKQRFGFRSVASAPEPDAAERLGVVQMLSLLSHRQRSVLVLHYYNDLTFAEISSLLDAPESTVKSLAQRGIKRLHSELQTEEKEDAVFDAG